MNAKAPQSSSKKRDLPVFWIVLLGSAVLYGLFLWQQPTREQIDPNTLPWHAQFDEQGQLHALGVTLHQTTLREAMDIFGKDVEIRLFTDADGGNKTAEAYFPTVYIGSIKGAIAVRLSVPPEELEAVYNRGAKISPTTSGAREVKLASQDNLDFIDKTLSSITLLPRNALNERAIQMRFGEPDRKEIQSDQLAHWFYERMGLELIIDPDGPEALQYSTQP